MKTTFMKFRTVFLLALTIPLFISCHKKEDDENITPTTPTNTKEQLYASQVYEAMQEIYLWNTSLPSSVNSKNYPTANGMLDYLMAFKINPQTNKAIDHYSFLDEIGNLSGEIGGGTASGDYGFMVKAAYNSSNQVSFFVNYVYKASPAGLAGVARSYEITKINGSTDVHPGVTSDGYLDTKSTGFINLNNALFNSTTASFTFKKTDGTSVDVSLKTASYSINSVLCDSVYTTGNQKTGYIVFNQFLGKTAQTELADVFSKFESKGVQNVIVDLRYNGGGSVETSEYFCNLMVPQTANGKTMYSYKMNTLLTDYYASQNVSMTSYIKKTNTFQAQKIYFIVSGNTASASELLINNLRPYFAGNLFIIGQTTYGKPCGFWATPIGYDPKQTTTKEGYDLYAVSFETVNSNSEGGYYAGMTPGASQYPGIIASDSFYLPWGSITDGCLSQALNHASTGAFKSAAAAPARIRAIDKTEFNSIDKQFRGMIDFRKHL